VSLRHRLKSIAINLGLALGVTVVMLVVVDLALIVTGILPPSHDPGDPEVGWYAAPATGAMASTDCVEMQSRQRYAVTRNEDGVRSDSARAVLLGAGPALEVVVSGDSHTDLCAPNAQTHFGETATALAALGRPAIAYARGSGKYSPLQAYLAIKPLLSEYQPDVFVLNLYTGNDFYDMLRIDDRPYFEGRAGAYHIAAPVWYTYDAPGEPPKSRVLFALRKLTDVTGIRRVVLRVSYLRDVAARQNVGAGVLWDYMRDLQRSADPALGYPQAFTAQMLNQQLFFHHFPGSREESLARVEALLRLIREAHPGVMLLLSPIPSYEAVVPADADTGMRAALSRLPITYETGRAEEEALYRALQPLAAATGWEFVNNLDALRGVEEPAKLYNHFDFHIEPPASARIGAAQAATIDSVLRSRRASSSPR